MKVSFVVARVEVGRVQRRYNVQRETLICAGICEVRCMRKTELHLTLPAREAPLKKAAPRQKASNARLCPSRRKPTEPHISFGVAHTPYRQVPGKCRRTRTYFTWSVQCPRRFTNITWRGQNCCNRRTVQGERPGGPAVRIDGPFGVNRCR